MAWIKQGLIYCPDGAVGWRNNSVMTPTPFLLDDRTIRIYCGFRDESGVSRIGFIDVSADDPGQVLAVSQQPVLDVGRPGTFDDNGLILGEVIAVDGDIRLYYVGFQKVEKVKFLAFSGLAISRDGGQTFERHSEAPVMDRKPNALYIRAIHSILRENGIFRVWYSVGHDWKIIGGVPYPAYYIRYTESKDGIHFDDDGVSCLQCQGDEYRIGRPRVRKAGMRYEMRYTSDTVTKDYRAGYAESDDGIHWTRMDDKGRLGPSSSGWDSEMACYPAILTAGNRKLMFYSGNGMGRTGVGYAVFSA